MDSSPAFDGHPVRDFASMTPEERLDDLSRKIALVHELRRSRIAPETDEPSPEAKAALPMDPR
jgi:hypothetical protein